jgi:hypothetical protein
MAAGAGIELGQFHPVALRAEGTAHLFLFGIGEEQPDCIPSAPCVSRSMASFVGIGSLSARWRPPLTPVRALLGIDYVYAPRTSNNGTSTTSGVNFGLGAAIDQDGRWSIEARYHHPRRALGLFRSLLQVTLNRAF